MSDNLEQPSFWTSMSKGTTQHLSWGTAELTDAKGFWIGEVGDQTPFQVPSFTLSDEDSVLFHPEGPPTTDTMIAATFTDEVTEAGVQALDLTQAAEKPLAHIQQHRSTKPSFLETGTLLPQHTANTDRMSTSSFVEDEDSSLEDEPTFVDGYELEDEPTLPSGDYHSANDDYEGSYNETSESEVVQRRWSSPTNTLTPFVIPQCDEPSINEIPPLLQAELEAAQRAFEASREIKREAKSQQAEEYRTDLVFEDLGPVVNPSITFAVGEGAEYTQADELDEVPGPSLSPALSSTEPWQPKRILNRGEARPTLAPPVLIREEVLNSPTQWDRSADDGFHTIPDPSAGHEDDEVTNPVVIERPMEPDPYPTRPALQMDELSDPPPPGGFDEVPHQLAGAALQSISVPLTSLPRFQRWGLDEKPTSVPPKGSGAFATLVEPARAEDYNVISPPMQADPRPQAPANQGPLVLGRPNAIKPEWGQDMKTAVDTLHVTEGTHPFIAFFVEATAFGFGFSAAFFAGTAVLLVLIVVWALS